MGKTLLENGVLKEAILYYSSTGGEHDVKKDVLGSNAVQIESKQKQKRRTKIEK